jgi:uncharacterized protein YgiM (DUF1202 family)
MFMIVYKEICPQKKEFKLDSSEEVEEKDRRLIRVNEEGKTNIVTVTWTSVSIRSGAGNEFPVMKTVKQGDKLTVVGQHGEWFNVRLEDGKKGWINSRVVK